MSWTKNAKLGINNTAFSLSIHFYLLISLAFAVTFEFMNKQCVCLPSGLY